MSIIISPSFLARHSRESGNPDFPQVRLLTVWIPAFAGMTDVCVIGE